MKATNFNQDLTNWKPTSCKIMNNMFDSATAFSHDIGDWPVLKNAKIQKMFDNTNPTMQDIVDSWKTRTCNKDAMTLSCQFNESN